MIDTDVTSSGPEEHSTLAMELSSAVSVYSSMSSADLDKLFKRVLSSVDSNILKITKMITALSKTKPGYRPKSIIRFIEQILCMTPGTLVQILERNALTPLLSLHTGIPNRRFSDFLLDHSRSGIYSVDLSLSYNEIALGCLRVLNERVLSIEQLSCECSSQKTCEHNCSFFFIVLFECCRNTTLDDEELRNGLLAHKTEHLVNLLLAHSTDDHVWSRAALALSAFHEGLSELEMFKHTDVKSFHISILFKLDDYIKNTLDSLCSENPFIIDVFLPLVSCIASPLASHVDSEKRYRTWQHVASVLLFHPLTSNSNHKDRFESIRDIIRKSDGPSYMLTGLFDLIDKSLGSRQDKAARAAVKALRFFARGLYADMASNVNCRFDSRDYFPKGAHVDDSSDYYQPWAYSMKYLAKFLRTKRRSVQYYVDSAKLEHATVYCLSAICSSAIDDLQNSSVEDIYDRLHMESFTILISRLLVMQMFGKSNTITVSEDEVLYVPQVAGTRTNRVMKDALNKALRLIGSSTRDLPRSIFTWNCPSSDVFMLAYLKNLRLEGPLESNPKTLCFFKTSDQYWGIKRLGEHAENSETDGDNDNDN